MSSIYYPPSSLTREEQAHDRLVWEQHRDARGDDCTVEQWLTADEQYREDVLHLIREAAHQRCGAEDEVRALTDVALRHGIARSDIDTLLRAVQQDWDDDQRRREAAAEAAFGANNGTP